jgi:hypothetical protein
MKRFLLAASFVFASALQAQIVERPEPFDTAGRVMAITPALALRLGLLPPAWRVTGEFTEARLFATSENTFVLVVTRPGGVVERYPVSIEERAYLGERANSLPPGIRLNTRELGEARGVRRAFIRNQTIIGLGIYAPAAAVALSDDGAGKSAIYLLVAGGAYFAAATLSREIVISEQQNSLATHMATRGAAMGLGLGYSLNASGDGRAAGIFASSLAGTAVGLGMARNLTSGETRSAGFGADASALLMLGTLIATDPDIDGDEDLSGNGQQNDGMGRGQVAMIVAAGAAGYPMGLLYARRASYNITSGDIGTLWVSGVIGSLATTPFLANSMENHAQLAVGVMTLGFAGGLVAGDRIFVRRMDHSAGEATLMTIGAAAGALMGGGVYVLADRDTDRPALGLALATAGAIGGVYATELAFPPEGDAGRMASRFHFNPTGALLAASGVRGTFPIARFAF